MTSSDNTPNPVALETRGSNEGRLFSPSAGRNKADIAAVLAEMLPRNAKVLEIGSGTGEHGIETLSLRPDLLWQFSDPDPQSRASQSAWIADQAPDLPAPLDLNVTRPNWTGALPMKFDVIFSANMIHIAPIEALKGLANLAELALTPAGKVIFYGPFLFGQASARSNLDFDLALKGKNPTWGVRELDSVKHIFAKLGFNQLDFRDMPKNNHIIGLSRH